MRRVFCFKTYQNNISLLMYVNPPLLPLLSSLPRKLYTDLYTPILPTIWPNSKNKKSLRNETLSRSCSETFFDDERCTRNGTIFRFGNESFVIRPRRRIRPPSPLFFHPTNPSIPQHSHELAANSSPDTTTYLSPGHCMQIYFHSRISNLPFSDVQLDSRENDPPRSIYIRTFHRRWGVRSLRIEAGGGVWRRPLNRDTHSGRKSL